MTIQSVEQALDSAIALLMYGSGAWLSYSLIAFVARPRKNAEETAAEGVSATGSISIEVMPETMAISPELGVDELLVEAAEAEKPLTKVEPVATEPVVTEPVVTEAIVDPVPLLPPAAVPEPVSLPIICEPVNWKKWKVGELRQASITKVCGVRTSPIGSNRKLKKADLIAQYEQNLKRMTYEAGTLLQRSGTIDAAKSEKIA